jgi:hypothetical protein
MLFIAITNKRPSLHTRTRSKEARRFILAQVGDKLFRQRLDSPDILGPLPAI